eukprot:11784602-Alexandrium_andersonii.AAC.1
MSASLVGSEMCIRDRAFRPVRGDIRSATRCSRPRYRPKGVGSSRVRPLRCLLYTSDAADDM